MVCTFTEECKNEAVYYVWFRDSPTIPFLGIANYIYACESCRKEIPEDSIAKTKPIARLKDKE